MATNVLMPKRGNSVESCLIVEWKVKPGDTVTVETPLCEIETDKATMEVLAGSPGTVLALFKQAGEDVPVMTPICSIGSPGEASSPGDSSVPTEEGATDKRVRSISTRTAIAEPIGPTNGRGGEATARGALDRVGTSPRARNLAEKSFIDASAIEGSGPEGRVIERDVRSALAGREPLTKAAQDLAGNRLSIPARGTGIGERVTAADMASADRHAVVSPSSGRPVIPTAAAGEGNPGEVIVEPIPRIRKLISDRMARSLAEAPQLSMHSKADATKLKSLRSRFKAADPSLGLASVTINDLVLFAVSRTLPAYPFLNSHKKQGSFYRFKRVHLGVAVDTPRGLMVPVIRNADSLSLRGISDEAKRLSAACREGTAAPEELEGSTFTVTNLGGYGVESFTPILNLPEVAILGVCSIENRMAIAGGLPAEVPFIGLSLTIDHGSVDGAPAAAFLRDLSKAIENIDLTMAG